MKYKMTVGTKYLTLLNLFKNSIFSPTECNRTRDSHFFFRRVKMVKLQSCRMLKATSLTTKSFLKLFVPISLFLLVSFCFIYIVLFIFVVAFFVCFVPTNLTTTLVHTPVSVFKVKGVKSLFSFTYRANFHKTPLVCHVRLELTTFSFAN